MSLSICKFSAEYTCSNSKWSVPQTFWFGVQIPLEAKGEGSGTVARFTSFHPY